MKYIVCSLALLLVNNIYAQDLINPHGLEKLNSSPTYESVAQYYKQLAASNSTMLCESIGETDVNEQLLVLFYSADGIFDPGKWKSSGKSIILINNGIHPGEPDGIVASMQLLWDIAHQKIKVPDNVVLAVIPVFNIGGAQQLRANTRANQNGPETTGFRGNGQNLDLNRDFIKMDAKETRSLALLFMKLDPDVLIDNHVSNGADYQHVMTLLSTQHDKLGGPMGKYLNDVFEPNLYKRMKTKGHDLVPYVNVWGDVPENGWPIFVETPRFLSGYAALFHTYAFVAETHMLKPFDKRVDATYDLMQTIIQYTGDNSVALKRTRQDQKMGVSNAKELNIEWKNDADRFELIEFKGYESGKKPSLVSGQPRLYYDKAKPYTKKVPFYKYCNPTQKVTVPQAYIIPQSWSRVLECLRFNRIRMKQFEKDTVMELTTYYIQDYNTGKAPYEGHYLHTDVSVTTKTQKINIRKGDYYINTQQDGKRYIVETLEPTATDAFFAWGFFDAVLQRKEYFSAYVFEDLAVELLEKDPELKAKLEKQRASSADFAKDGKAQLQFVYQNSEFGEPEYMRYPVYRLE